MAETKNRINSLCVEMAPLSLTSSCTGWGVGGPHVGALLTSSCCCCRGMSGEPPPLPCSHPAPGTGLCSNLQLLFSPGSLRSCRRLEWLSQLHLLPSQGSLKPVTEIGSVVPAGLLAIQQVPRGGSGGINHIGSLSSGWLTWRTAGWCTMPP